MSKSKKIICELIDFDNEIYTRQQLAEFRAFFSILFLSKWRIFLLQNYSLPQGYISGLMNEREWCVILESDTGILGKTSECSYQEYYVFLARFVPFSKWQIFTTRRYILDTNIMYFLPDLSLFQNGGFLQHEGRFLTTTLCISCPICLFFKMADFYNKEVFL